uniref:Ubiquitin-like protease family profile domain-containing protein n=1 Tax=Leersia perrieri TaxID=77586 RepID=A0A0D9WQ28_9ORYZ
MASLSSDLTWFDRSQHKCLSCTADTSKLKHTNHWILLSINLDDSSCIIDDSMHKDQILYQNMLDLLQRVWVRFTSKEPGEWK